MVEVAVREDDGAWRNAAEEFVSGGENALSIMVVADIDEDIVVGIKGDEIGVGDSGGDAVDVGGGGLCG